MKTLILSDQTWEAMQAALEQSAAGAAVLASFGEQTESPPPADLVRMARAKAPAPSAYQRAREIRDAGAQAAEDTRLAMDALIREAHAAGVGATMLSRWFGLHVSRIYEIIGSSE